MINIFIKISNNFSNWTFGNCQRSLRFTAKNLKKTQLLAIAESQGRMSVRRNSCYPCRRGTTGIILKKTKSSGNSFKLLQIDSVFSADFEYHIRFSEFVDCSSGIFKITLKNSIKICTQVDICTRIFCGQCFYLNILVSDLSGWEVLSNHVETRVADHLHGYFFPWATRTITH